MDVALADLWQRRGRAFLKALREVGVTALITLTPVWAGTVISLLFKEINSVSEAFLINTARGDLFLLATAAIAPLTLYMTVKRDDMPPRTTVHFPGGWAFVISLVILFGGCAIMFSVKRVSELPGVHLNLNQDFLYSASIVMYLVSVVVSLIVTAIKFFLDSLDANDLRTEVPGFIIGLGERIEAEIQAELREK